MKSSVWLLLAVAAVVGVLFYISSTGTKPPPIPPDAVHRVITTQEGCVACHAPGKTAPLKEGHPPKEQCLICHKTVGR